MQKFNEGGLCTICHIKLFMGEDRKSGFCQDCRKPLTHEDRVALREAQKCKRMQYLKEGDAWTDAWLARFAHKEKMMKGYNLNNLTCRNCGVFLLKENKGNIWCGDCAEIHPTERDGYYYLQLCS